MGFSRDQSATDIEDSRLGPARWHVCMSANLALLSEDKVERCGGPPSFVRIEREEGGSHKKAGKFHRPRIEIRPICRWRRRTHTVRPTDRQELSSAARRNGAESPKNDRAKQGSELPFFPPSLPLSCRSSSFRSPSFSPSFVPSLRSFSFQCRI